MSSSLILELIHVIVNPDMAKRRKTRQQKIILQLKRQLVSAQIEPRQEPISYRIEPEAKKIVKPEKTDKLSFSIDPRLIRKDLLKTLALASAIISLEAVLYLKLR